MRAYWEKNWNKVWETDDFQDFVKNVFQNKRILLMPCKDVLDLEKNDKLKNAAIANLKLASQFFSE